MPQGYSSLPWIGTPPSDTPLTDISANIRKILNPNWEMQQEMQLRLMSNPDLLHQVAEVERNAPGTVAKLGFGRKLTDIIQKTPETIKQKSQKELMNLQLEDARNDIQQFKMVETKFNQEQEDRVKSLQGIEGFKKFDVPKEIDAFVAGKPNKEFLQALTIAGNENQQIVQALISDKARIRALGQEHDLAMKRIAAQESMAEARERRMLNLQAAKEDKSYQKMLNANAVDSYQKEQVGTPGAWRKVLDLESGGAQRAMELAQNGGVIKDKAGKLIPLTDEDRQLMAIGQHMISNKAAGISARKKGLLAEARKEMGAAQNKSLKPEEVSAYVSNMKQYYAEISKIDPTFNIDVVQKGKNIQLIDNNTGVPIDDESQAVDITRLPTPIDKQTNKPVSVRKVLDDAVADYTAAPNTILGTGTTKSKFLQEFKKKYGNEFYNLLKKRI